MQLDVTDDASVQAALRVIKDREGRLDVLVNNAGVADNTLGADGVTAESASAVFGTNVVGVVRVTQAAIPLLRKSDNPVVVNISSALGSFWAVTDPERHQSHNAFVVYGPSIPHGPNGSHQHRGQVSASDCTRPSALPDTWSGGLLRLDSCCRVRPGGQAGLSNDTTSRVGGNWV